MPFLKSLHKQFRLMRIARSAAHLKDKEITILSNNCSGSFIYQDLKLRYNSPTVGLFFYAPDYLRFLENLDECLAMDLNFARESRYKGAVPYPIGLLGDIEIHFMHYQSPKHARTKWNERKQRIRKDKLFIIGAEMMECTPEIIGRFDKLPFANKIFFTKYAYPQFASTVHLKKYEHRELSDFVRWRDWVEYIDLVKWLNGEPDFRIS